MGRHLLPACVLDDPPNPLQHCPSDLKRKRQPGTFAGKPFVIYRRPSKIQSDYQAASITEARPVAMSAAYHTAVGVLSRCGAALH